MTKKEAISNSTNTCFPSSQDDKFNPQFIKPLESIPILSSLFPLEGERVSSRVPPSLLLLKRIEGNLEGYNSLFNNNIINNKGVRHFQMVWR
jgi:hypothetical protein